MRLKVDEVGAVRNELHAARETDDEVLLSATVSDRNVQANGSSGPAPEVVVLLVGPDCGDGVTFVFVRRKLDSGHVLLSRQRQGLGYRKQIGALLTLGECFCIGERHLKPRHPKVFGSVDLARWHWNSRESICKICPTRLVKVERTDD